MSRLVMTGGRKLKGEIFIEGSKNAVLPILAATVLNGNINIIKNCPRLRDVEVALEILQSIGCKVQFDEGTAIIDSSTLEKTEIPVDLAAEMRSSIIFLGPMLARCGKVTISYPGECDRVQKPRGDRGDSYQLLHKFECGDSYQFLTTATVILKFNIKNDPTNFPTFLVGPFLHKLFLIFRTSSSLYRNI